VDNNALQNGDEEQQQGVTAYHGSPHDLDEFSMDKIGTGEGAQAYGHGLYFAENEDVARGYRDTLSKDYYATDQGLFNPDELKHMNVRVAARGDLDAAANKARDLLARQPENAPLLNSDLERLEAARAANPRRHAGHMYEVYIDAHPDHFLDWDAPILEQPHAYGRLMDALYQRADGPPEFGPDKKRVPWDALISEIEGGADITGSELHDRLTSREVIGLHPKDAASFLHEAGIKGIRYLDSGSRGAGEGSRNYVVFNDKLVKVRRKYAEGGGVDDEQQQTGIPVWHGSGADFDAFRNDMINTGMGAQAFGHGHYFSEDPDFARSFRDAVTRDAEPEQYRIGQQPLGKYYDRVSSRADRLPPAQSEAEYDKLAALEDLQIDGDVLGVRKRAEQGSYRPETVDWFENEIAPKYARPGKLYEVEVGLHPHEMLDWDKPLAEQPHVWNAIGEHMGDPEIVLQNAGHDHTSATGSHFYDALAGTMQNQKAASARLASMGIHGLTYMDKSMMGDPIRNYVVFDEGRVRVKNKYADGGGVDGQSPDEWHPDTWYHGTPDARDIYKSGFMTPSERFNGNDPRSIYFFAQSPQVAKTYADPHRAFDYQGAEPEVIPVRLRMSNPKTIDWGGKPFRGREKDESGYDIHDHIDAAREAGHDGVIIRNVIDTYNAKGKPSTIAAVFDASRIRHAKAARDPSKKDSRDIMAARGGGIDHEARRDGGGVESDIPQIDNAISVFPKPQRMFPDDARVPGGQYLNAATKEDMTHHKASMASIGVAPGGKPYFRASPDAVDETGSPGRGSAVAKTNLFKQKAGWRWLDAPEGHEGTSTIVSVEHRGRHHYALNAHFPKGVDFARYENATSEPRLRPTTRGNVILGPQVGSISVRGKEHPVHEHVIVKQRGGVVSRETSKRPARDVVNRALMLVSAHRGRP
jgi:hypothetical protein